MFPFVLGQVVSESQFLSLSLSLSLFLSFSVSQGCGFVGWDCLFAGVAAGCGRERVWAD